MLARRLAASRMGNPLRSSPGARPVHQPVTRCDERARRAAAPLASTLQELQRICDALNHHHQPAARELAAAIWRLYCALSQLEQAPVAGTIGEGTT